MILYKDDDSNKAHKYNVTSVSTICLKIELPYLAIDIFKPSTHWSSLPSRYILHCFSLVNRAYHLFQERSSVLQQPLLECRGFVGSNSRIDN